MNRHRARGPSRLWVGLAQAPYVPIAAYFGVLGIVALAGGTGITPGGNLDTILPTWLVIAWTIGVALGGTLATIGALAQRTRIESAGLGLFGYGATLYGAVVAYATWPHDLDLLAVPIVVVAMCLIRMRVLALARHALEVARGIDDERET